MVISYRYLVDVHKFCIDGIVCCSYEGQHSLDLVRLIVVRTVTGRGVFALDSTLDERYNSK